MTVGQFLFDCLRKEGITEIFGVPGDYNFSLLDILEQDKEINFVNCCNELNAGYAADGYARVKGIGAIITTFGVGELSACCAIAGSYSESVPVIHIVSAPRSMLQKEHKKVHHTLLDGNFDVFKKMYESIVAYTAAITCENAALEIPAAILKSKETKKPVYLTIPTDIVTQPILPRDFTAPQKKTSTVSMQEALGKILPMLQQSKNPVLISEVYVMRYGLEKKVEEIAEKLDIPVVTTLMGKGSFDENHKNFMGFYCGKLGSEEVRNLVETSDCIVAVGLVWNDYNTGLYTAIINPNHIIDIQPCFVKVGMTVYENVLMQDLLAALLNGDIGKKPAAAIHPMSFPFDSRAGMAEDTVSASYYYPVFQEMIRENDIVIAEAGTFIWGLAQLRLKSGVTYIAQGGWGCIGYALPAAFGACVAAPGRRVLLFTGEGSLQLTVQELSSMLSNGCKPIIFILNNKGYTIEKYLNIPVQADYNNIPNWNCTKLPEAFGSKAYTVRVRTNRELDEAILQVQEAYKTQLCLIEVLADPMDAPQIVLKIHQEILELQKRG